MLLQQESIWNLAKEEKLFTLQYKKTKKKKIETVKKRVQNLSLNSSLLFTYKIFKQSEKNDFESDWKNQKFENLFRQYC